jgi:hypothetical protein
MNLLAQASPDLSFNQIGTAAAIMGFFLSLAVNIAMLWNMSRSQKREVKFEQEFASRAEFEHLLVTIDKNKDEAEAGRGKIYEQIDKVRVELSGKIDSMEGRVIATLKNTGAI